nr:hypothetical protein [Tanacetum cinerariifolium]
MNPIATQQAALNNALVPSEKRLKIKICNSRIAFTNQQKEDTYQLTLEALNLTTWRIFAAVINRKTLCINMTTENMPYLRFTKVIIDHFISKDNTISMRNKINLHTSRDDTLLGTLKFFSKTKDYHKYEAVIPDEMINDDIKLSKAYKTYLNYATRKVPLKKTWKFKKHTSPKLKTVPASPKEPIQKGKRVRELPKRPLLPQQPVLSSKILLISLYRRRKNQLRLASGSSEGADFELEVPDEPTEKTKDTSKGTGVNSGVPNVSKDNSFDNNNDSWGDCEDESDDVHDKDDNDDDDGNDDDIGNDDDGHNDVQDSEQTDSNDEDNLSFTLKDYEEEEQDREYVFSLEKDKSDDEEKMFEEDDDDVVKELYEDLNIT